MTDPCDLDFDITDPTSRQRGRPKKDQTLTLKKKLWSKVPDLGSTSRQSQCDFDFDFDRLLKLLCGTDDLAGYTPSPVGENEKWSAVVSAAPNNR
jgi:hypothetical protein